LNLYKVTQSPKSSQKWQRGKIFPKIPEPLEEQIGSWCRGSFAFVWNCHLSEPEPGKEIQRDRSNPNLLGYLPSQFAIKFRAELSAL
jgi:hypothetical protein